MHNRRKALTNGMRVDFCFGWRIELDGGRRVVDVRCRRGSWGYRYRYRSRRANIGFGFGGGLDRGQIDGVSSRVFGDP